MSVCYQFLQTFSTCSILTNFRLKSMNIIVEMVSYAIERESELHLPTEFVAGTDVQFFVHVVGLVTDAYGRLDLWLCVARLVISQEFCRITRHIRFLQSLSESSVTILLRTSSDGLATLRTLSFTLFNCPSLPFHLHVLYSPSPFLPFPLPVVPPFRSRPLKYRQGVWEAL